MVSVAGLWGHRRCLAGLVVPELARRGANVRGLVREEASGARVRERGAGEIADEHGLPGNSLVLRTILGREPRTLGRYLRDLVSGVPTDAA